MVLARNKSERDDTGDVHLRTEDLHVETELDSDALNVLETFLIVGSSTTDPDGNLVLVEEGSDLTESADDTLECGGDLSSRLAFVVKNPGKNQKNLRW